MSWQTISKSRTGIAPAPNLADYQKTYAEFSWESAQRELSGLPQGMGLNIAHEAIDRHAINLSLSQHLAIRWLGKNGSISDYTFNDLRWLTNRFANVLRHLYLTGDLARRDADGYFWFVGRKDDVIKTSGHLIGPFEVESILMEHKAVAEAGVIGKPDPVALEIVKAFVLLKDGYEPSSALRRELLAFARTRLGAEEFPRSGKARACWFPAQLGTLRLNDYSHKLRRIGCRDCLWNHLSTASRAGRFWQGGRASK